MRVMKVVLICLCVLSLLFPLIAGIISSNMQSYYKSQIDDSSKSVQEAQEILAKKLFWAQIGESTNLKNSYIIFALSAVLLIGIKKVKL